MSSCCKKLPTSKQITKGGTGGPVQRVRAQNIRVSRVIFVENSYYYHINIFEIVS